MFANLNSNQQQFFNQQTNNIEIAYSQQYFNTNNNHNFNNHHNQQQQQQHLPSCIVIGCKNSYSNSSVKYYQVPLLTDNNSNNIARQWYINTLREDLLDFVLSSSSNTSITTTTTTTNNNGLKSDLLPTPHYVCIEHFDEESFNNNTTTTNEQIIILKDDAVPSLFEIEVFQKMIAHQEQIALNQQKQLIQLNNQQKQQQQTTIPVKRARMDPDTRAALIQRVPKAVKRTSLLSMVLQPPPPPPPPQIPQQVTTPKPIITPTFTQPQQIKAPKAVKHTSLRYNDPSLTNRMETNNTKPQQQQTSSNTTTTPTPKLPKALKHPSANILLPPPIMQSTKRINKAIKHTGGGSNAYYQSNKQLQPNNNQQPLTQLNLNNDLTKSTPVVAATIQPTTNIKMPTTTTYVYKRILQQPEIDLNLDCEDEEIILLSAPSSPIPPPPVPEPVEVEPELPNRIQTDDLKLNIVKKLKNSLLNNKSESNKTEIKRAINTTVVPGGDGVKKKNKVGRKKKIIIDSTSESSDIDDLEIDEDELIDEDLLDDENDYIDDNDDDDDDDDYLDDDDDGYEEPVKKKLNTSKRNSLIKTPTNTNNLLNVPTLNANYAELLSKFYSRSLGSSNNSETESSSKRTKYSNKIAKDLIVGNYPAKCNVCNLILDNNIELTSHICSHLESGGSNNTNNNSNTSINESSTTPPPPSNTYISPFEAVTTTCGVCDTTFSQPFDLIKHLDQKHMKQLNEYKCRICEKQHSKFSDLIDHLNKTHVSQEMPYKCDACGFRTSFYADAIYHIKKEHKSTLRHFCPYCLKSLILPYNEKQGYVQCNQFYSHLITHFNKHENEMLMPSKCKHCQKCILHVRFMKDHLCNDHMSLATTTTSTATKSNKTTTTNSKTNKRTNVNNSLNLRKRRRSTMSEKEMDDSFQTNNIYDFIDDESKLLNEIIKTEPNIQNETTTTTITTNGVKSRKRRSSVNSTSTTNPITTTPTTINKISKIDEIINNKSFTKTDIELAVLSGPPYKRKQKALKQTNIKTTTTTTTATSSNSRSLRSSSFDESMRTFLKSIPAITQKSSSPEIITTYLAGNVRFTNNKNKFKCVECGDCDLRSHFRNDYTCHQCRYNTNCSNSFEYHLHGHLVSKRVALWNKVIKTNTEDYTCLCGFHLNSTKDNNYNANTGNLVAAHLMKCEYKYCQVKINN